MFVPLPPSAIRSWTSHSLSQVWEPLYCLLHEGTTARSSSSPLLFSLPAPLPPGVLIAAAPRRRIHPTPKSILQHANRTRQRCCCARRRPWCSSLGRRWPRNRRDHRADAPPPRRSPGALRHPRPLLRLTLQRLQPGDTPTMPPRPNRCVGRPRPHDARIPAHRDLALRRRCGRLTWGCVRLPRRARLERTSRLERARRRGESDARGRGVPGR